jgi:membrane protein
MADIELEPKGARGLFSFARGATPHWLRPFFAVLHDATAGLFRHDGVMVACAISYSLIFALFPFAIFMVALGAVFGGSDLAGYISREALTVLPAHVIQSLDPELNRIFAAANRARPLTIGLAITLVSITGSVEAIRDGLNRAYGCTEGRHLVRRYVSSVFFVFVGTAFLLVVAALGIAVPILIGILDRYVPGPPIQTGWLETAREALLAAVTLAMLFAFHLFLPARRGHIKGVIGGVLFTLIGWWLAGKVFGLYITEIANYTATYAGLAGIVILMFFLYIQALIFLLGAEMNRSIADLRGEALTTKDQ